MDIARPGLWERSRRGARAEITDTAMRLFLEQGFDATTIDQIVTEVGISRRSFFRYFGTKEDVVLGNLVELGLSVQAALRARPATEPPWEALTAALLTLAAPTTAPERTLRTSRMLHGTPSLKARLLEKQLRWLELLVPEVERRMGILPGGPADARASAIVASALACLDAANQTWTLHDGEGDLAELFTEAVAAVRT